MVLAPGIPYRQTVSQNIGRKEAEVREIKFRAWNKEHSIMFGVDEIRRDYLSEDARQIAFIRNDCDLMQYTGLRDKNGKEIYEGDITNHGIIRFGDNYMTETIGFYLEDIEWCNRGGKKHHDTHTLFANTTKFEVIGNIYENPELVERQK